MRLDPDDHINVPRLCAVSARVAFSREPDALPVSSPRLNAHFQRLGLGYCTFAMAGWTGGYVFPGAVTARTLHNELHPPAGLRLLSGSVALRTFSRLLEKPLPVTI